MNKKQKHKRVNDILLASLERQAIAWLVRRMPAWVTPDLLTGLGLLAALVIAAGYALTNFDRNFLWLASFGLVLNWFGDSLDGSLARYRKIERPKFGYFIDHTIDAFTQFIVVIGIGLSPYVSFKFALFFLIGYFMVSIHTYITTYVRGVFKLSYGGFGPTEVRVLAFLGNIIIYFVGLPGFTVPLLQIALYDFLFLLTGSTLIVVYIVSTAREAVKLATAD